MKQNHVAPGCAEVPVLAAPAPLAPAIDERVVRPPAAVTVPAPRGANPAPGSWTDRVATAGARSLARRGVGPAPLAVFAAAFAATALLVFSMGHWGIAAILGFVALGAIVPAVAVAEGGPTRRDPVAGSLDPLVDLLLAGGVVGALAVLHPPVAVLLGLVVFVLGAWLPRVVPASSAPSGEGGALLWTPRQGTAVLLLGALLGRPVPALLLLGIVLAGEGTLHLLQALQGPSFRPLPARSPAWVAGVLPGSGGFPPAARWASLGLAAVLVVLLPQGSLWRF